MANTKKISASLEDYIEVIYNLLVEKGSARVSDIAKIKVVKMASVNNALKRLANGGFVKQELYGMASLTTKGTKLAKTLSERHKVIQNFLENVVGIKTRIANIDACAIEHHVHKETVNGLINFTKRQKKRLKNESKT